MKRIITVLICLIAVISVAFNIVQINSNRKISNDISNYIIANVQQLSAFYEPMYSDGEPTEYYDSSLIYIDDCCDSIKEEIVFYNTLYPKRILFLNDIIDDYKLLIRSLKNPDSADKAQALHKQLQQYIIKYDSVDYKNNRAESLFETDKKIKADDENNYYLLHDEIVKLSKNK